MSLKVIMIMPGILLQKPSFKSNSKQHGETLSRRLVQWFNGDFDELVRESRTIQSMLPKTKPKSDPEHIAKTFAKLMLQGKVRAALRLLDSSSSSGILQLNEQTVQDLKEKHPPSQELNDSVMLKGAFPFIDPAYFSNIDERTIAKAALKTKGGCGPSGMDADGWKRILVSKSFKSNGKELRSAIAKFSQILCTQDIDQSSSCLEVIDVE